MADGAVGRGAAYMIGASICFAIMAALVKVGAADVGPWAVVLVRSVVILGIGGALLVRRGARLRFVDHRTLVVRSLAGFTAMLAYYLAIERVPLPTAVTLQYTSPMFVAAFAPLVGERVTPRMVGWLLFGFVGVVAVVEPVGWPDAGAWLALASGALAGVAYHAVRKLRMEDPDAVVVHFALVSTVLSAPAAARLVQDPPSTQTALVLLGVGLSAAGGQVLLTRAYHHASAALVTGFGYSGVVFGILFGVLAFHEAPGWSQILGSVVIALAGLGLARGGRA